MRRLNVTEALLFVVRWGGNELSEGGEREQDEGWGGRQWEQRVGRSQSVRQTCSVSLQNTASLPNKQHDNLTNAAQWKSNSYGTRLNRLGRSRSFTGNTQNKLGLNSCNLRL